MHNSLTHPRCESLWCRLSHWWQGLPHRRQNLVIASASVLAINAIALVAASLGPGQEAPLDLEHPGLGRSHAVPA
jgi:hypothetical protein